MAKIEKKARIIFHIDMNSFYASVEAAHHPELRGKALAIAGKVEDRRGIIVTASYEARAKGVKATMPVWQAKKLCPGIIIKTPNFNLYRKVSQQLFELLRSYTPLVEKVSIDEGYIDVTELGLTQHPVKLAQEIQQRVKNELHLPSSIGIAPNKFLAKMASNMKKPMGITILRKRDLSKKLWPLPIDDMYGVGKKTAEKLRAIDIQTIGDLARFNPTQIKVEFGIQGMKLHERANGLDNRIVDPNAEAAYKSISQSTTLPDDIASEVEARPIFIKLAMNLANKLKEKKYIAYQIAITIRYHDWQTVSRAKTVKQAVQSQHDILDIAMFLFNEHWDGRAIRLLGVSAHSLEDAGQATKQLDLFTYEKDAKDEPLIDAIHQLEKKFGDHIVRRGLPRHDISAQNKNRPGGKHE